MGLGGNGRREELQINPIVHSVVVDEESILPMVSWTVLRGYDLCVTSARMLLTTLISLPTDAAFNNRRAIHNIELLACLTIDVIRAFRSAKPKRFPGRLG